VFKKEFGIHHHVVSERIVRGDVPLGAGLKRAMRKWSINVFEVLAVTNGKASSQLRELFNHSINIDTIEAIIRSGTYLYENQLFRPPSDVLNALLTPSENSCEVLDSFWKLKDEVYNRLINNATGVLADYVCQQYMRNCIDSFDEQHYYLTEPDLRERHPKLFATLDGAFNSHVEYCVDMAKNIGGFEDTTEKLTRRLLFMLEGDCLFNRPVFDTTFDNLLQQYVRETITEHQLCRFLLNDLIRYYRTICVDFEYRTYENGKPWGDRSGSRQYSG
jgi:hypothetical protein